MSAEPLTVGSMCSGYGGLEMGLGMVRDIDVRWHSETDTGAATVLATRSPDVPNLGDLTTVDWATVEPVDIVCAGFPCQPISEAGRRKVTNDARWIWPHIADAVRVLRPRNVVLENVPPLLRPWLDNDGWWNPAPIEEVSADLAALGYVGSWCSVRASDFGAPHIRERVFVVAADPDGEGLEGPGGLHAAPRESEAPPHGEGPAAHADRRRSQAGSGLGHGATPRVVQTGTDVDRLGFPHWGPYEPAIARWEHVTGRPAPEPVDARGLLTPVFVEWMMGLPAGWVTDVGLSRAAQLRVLGNGVVPAQAALALVLMPEGDDHVR